MSSDLNTDDKGHDLDASDEVKVIASYYNCDTNWFVTMTPCDNPEVDYNVTFHSVTLRLTIEVMTLTPVTEVNRLHSPAEIRDRVPADHGRRAGSRTCRSLLAENTLPRWRRCRWAWPESVTCH